MIHETIENHYRLNTKLMMRFNWSLQSLDEMMPFEREVYYSLIIEELEKKKNEHANA